MLLKKTGKMDRIPSKRPSLACLARQNETQNDAKNVRDKDWL